MSSLYDITITIERNKEELEDNTNIIPNDLLYSVLNHTKLSSMEKLCSLPKISECYNSHKLLWNHFMNTDNRINSKMYSVKECKEIYRRRLENIRNITSDFKFKQIVTKQSDMTILKIVGNKIFSCSDDRTIKIYDLNTLALIDTFTGHTGGVWAFDTDGDLMVSGSTDKTVRLVSINYDNTLSVVNVSKVHTATVRCVLLTNKFIISGSRDAKVMLYDRFLTPLATLTGHVDSVRSMDANDQYLVTGSYDGTVILWSLEQMKFLKNLQYHSHRVYIVKIFKYLGSVSVIFCKCFLLSSSYC